MPFHKDLTGADLHAPKSHAGSHIDGTDDIQLATPGQKGLMSAAQASKLESLDAIYDFGGTFNGSPTSSFTMLRVPVTRSITLPASLTGSRMIAEVAATAETVFSLQKDGVEFGTATFAASGTEATFAAATETSFSNTNNFKIVAPATPDATLADLGWAIVGSR